jgi:hypothetical protein
MRLKNLDLIVTLIIAVMNVIWILLPSHLPVIGIILSLPLVFVLPGYTLTEVLFRKRLLETSHRLVLSIGLSLAIDILGGLILNLLPLEGISWAVFLGLPTTIFSLLAAYLRRGTPMNGVRLPRLRLTIYEGILFGLAALVIALSIMYDSIGLAQEPRPGFTQLWMLPAAQSGKSCAVRLGVRSFESTSVTYRITMTMNGTQVTTWPAVVLAPQGEWDRLVPILPTAADAVSIEGRLYRLDKPQAVYREVHVTLYSCPTSKVAPTPYPVLASTYSGTIHDIPADLTTKMTLTKIQQSRGNINGYLTVGAGLQGSGSFGGMVTAAKQIKFTATDRIEHATFSFEGGIDSHGNIAGSYCGLNQKGQCSSEYGLWSVASTSS